MKYERQIKMVDDSADLQEQIRGHHDYRFVAAIPWGGAKFLVFEREVQELPRYTGGSSNDHPF